MLCDTCCNYMFKHIHCPQVECSSMLTKLNKDIFADVGFISSTKKLCH